MALTTAQKLSCYEVLGVSYGPGSGANVDKETIHNSLGIMMSLTEMDTLRDELDLYIDNLSSDVQTRVEQIVSEWDSLGYNLLKIENGNVGDAGGVSIDLNGKRDLLRERLQIYIPVVHIVEQLKRKQGPGNQRSVTFAR